MRGLQPALVLLAAALILGACGGGYVRKEIEGNNTGGLIPPAGAAGKNVQSLADAHCARWKTRARITFSGADAGGDTIFVCETASGEPALLAAPEAQAAASQPPQAQQAPATQQAPVKR